MDYKILYIVLSSITVIVAFFLVLSPSARYKAPASKLTNIEKKENTNEVQSDKNHETQLKPEGKIV